MVFFRCFLGFFGCFLRVFWWFSGGFLGVFWCVFWWVFWSVAWSFLVVFCCFGKTPVPDHRGAPRVGWGSLGQSSEMSLAGPLGVPWVCPLDGPLAEPPRKPQGGPEGRSPPQRGPKNARLTCKMVGGLAGCGLFRRWSFRLCSFRLWVVSPLGGFAPGWFRPWVVSPLVVSPQYVSPPPQGRFAFVTIDLRILYSIPW